MGVLVSITVCAHTESDLSGKPVWVYLRTTATYLDVTIKAIQRSN